MEKCKPFCKEMHLVESSIKILKKLTFANYKCPVCGKKKQFQFNNAK